jgi:hypothetical protein
MRPFPRAASLAATLALLGCGAGTEGTGTGGGGNGGAGGTDGQGGGTTQATTSTGMGGGFATVTTGAGGGIQCSPGGPDDDVDGDGYSPNQGDCEDCDPNRNPNAIEVPTADDAEPFDEDCDGEVDEAEEPPCDVGIPIDAMDPLEAARAIELCKTSSGPGDWGVVDAKWVVADGGPPPSDPASMTNFHLGHGFLDDFGPNVELRRGDRMLVLSSGTARRPDDPGYQNVQGFTKQYSSGFPQGFPKESPACPGTFTGTVYDPTGVELTVRTPSNATGLSFDFNFYTYEWPGFVCSQYNDFFIAILDPIPMGQSDGNISFDGQGNPISVNNALLDVCGCPENPPSPCLAGGKTFDCPLGNIQLIGTGFGFDTAFQDHGATSWLRTTAPVPKDAEIRLRFAVHDSGDGSLDSTSLIDNFRWVATPGTTVGTNPVPQ